MLRRITSFVCALFLTIAASAQAQTGTVECDPVQGDLDAVIEAGVIAGMLTGDVEGTWTSTVVATHVVMTPLGPARHIRARGTLTTATGTFETRDSISVLAFAGQRLWQGRHRLVEGTGEYENHLGRLKTRGHLLQGGVADLRYRGAICAADATDES